MMAVPWPEGLDTISLKEAVPPPDLPDPDQLVRSPVYGSGIGIPDWMKVAGIGEVGLVAGGALLGGLAGKWAEDQQHQESKKTINRLAEYAPTGDAVGRELGVSLDSMQPVGDLSGGVHAAGRQARSASGARAGVSRQAEGRAAMQGLESIKAAVHRLDLVRSQLNRARAVTAARAASGLGSVQGAVAAGSASYLDRASAAQRAVERQTGDTCRNAIAGLTKMVALAYDVGGE